MRDAENGRENQAVKTNPHYFRLKFLEPVSTELVDPLLDVLENGLLFLVIHQQMVGLRVVMVGF